MHAVELSRLKGRDPMQTWEPELGEMGSRGREGEGSLDGRLVTYRVTEWYALC